MELEVIYFGRLRDLADGKTRETVTFDGINTLKDFIKELGERFGGEFSDTVVSTRGLRILVNGHEYQLLSGMDTKLKDKDTVVFLPPIFGG